MHADEKDLLDVLKRELEFLGKGGYRRSSRDSWRPAFIFEDSPTCMNHDSKKNPVPCSDCALIQLVPPELRSGKTPCRQIPFNATGETLDSLYRYGDQHEIEETLRNWLVETIHQLEGQRKLPGPALREHSPANEHATELTALHPNLHPTCANPGCSATFRWIDGGKFFRFRPDDVARIDTAHKRDTPDNGHGVLHFWLCERCAHLFTLVYDNPRGVMVTLLYPELPLAYVVEKSPDANSHNG